MSFIPAFMFYKTCSSNKASSLDSGSRQNPGCTREVCITVLRIAVSQRNREGGSSWAIGPLPLSPAEISMRLSR